METEWLNKLEKHMKKSPQSAVDAEEAAGLLDVSFSCPRSYPNLLLSEILPTRVDFFHIVAKFIRDSRRISSCS